MKKILYIPSWYPTPENRMKGSFFREQAFLFNDFDIFVTTIVPLEVNIFKFSYNYLKKRFLYFDIQTPPKGYGIYYFQIEIPNIFKLFRPLANRIERINFKIMCKYSFFSLKNKLDDLNWRPDLIHAQSTVDGGIFAYYLSRKFNIPYIITEHQVFLLQNFSAFKIDLIHQAISKATSFLAVSEHQKRQILMNGISCFPKVVGNLVDDTLFNIDRQGNNIFTILVVTYPSYIKDNETLFKAVKILTTKNITNFKVQIIGGDFNNLQLKDKENPLYKEAEKADIIDYVEILNYIDRAKMPEFYNKADVFVSTSIAETFGVSQCEAMMCGVPVIATANGGIDDMISESNGIKIPIQNHQSLAQAIMQVKNREIQFDPQEVRNSVVYKFGKTAFKNNLTKIYTSI
ncbi:MAG: glycosyltransferase family 4 protein [Bacteroidetes bacterium]|nr:glycosyltransferase family 4 protein [Bacteroidota bacterium]